MLQGRYFMRRVFRDTAQRGTKSGGSFGGDPGDKTYTYDSANTIPCFLDASRSKEAADGTENTRTDATIYMPAGTTLAIADRIKITHIDRTALSTARIFAIVGEPNALPSGLEVGVLEVTGNSNQ